MAADDLLAGTPATAPGIAKLSAALSVAASELARQLHETALSDPNPPQGKIEAIEETKATLKRLEARLETVSDSPSEVLGPAFEDQLLAHLFEAGAKSERSLGEHLQQDAWDVAAKAEDLAEQGLIVHVAGSSTDTPLRRWQITDKGREQIGIPSAR
jgi:hypothetical protein